MGIKERITQRMTELGLKPATVSSRAGLSATYIRDLLRHPDPNPRMQHLTALAEVLEVSAAWLMSGGDKVEPAEIIDIWDSIPDRSRDEARRMLKSLAGGDKSA